MTPQPQVSETAQDSGVACLCLLLTYHGLRGDYQQIIHEFGGNRPQLDNIALIRSAKKYKLKSRSVTTSVKRLAKHPLPAMAKDNNGGYFIIAKVVDDQVLIQRPFNSLSEKSFEQLEQFWSGELLLVTRRAEETATSLKFGMKWFIPVLAKYKLLLTEVLFASFFLQSFALITPLFFQVIIDKVLVHRGVTTLDVLMTGLIGIILFEAVLGFLRTFIFSHTTSRVDVQLGSRLFKHLLALPISYFESRPAGQTVARVRELDTVREFITSSSLTVLIDLVFTVIFFAVMWLFSPLLTLIVLGSIPAYVLISLLITPSLRKRVEERFYRGAANQAFLVESVTGAETLKAMAVEPQMHDRWDESLAAYVKTSFKTTVLSAAGSQAVQVISKVTMALILWFGAKLVMAGDLTVGQLVAFNMLAGQVGQPIIRIAQLWQDFQQFRISIQRLGDILNTKTEHDTSSMPDHMPAIKGRIELKDVTFRYRPEEREVLNNTSLNIEAGQMICIVGRSGSGKSTVTKLIQRLYSAEKGQILIDGIDINLMDPAWLRRQIGVVLQDNILFNKTVRENIALANPTLGMDRVMRVAQLAGAHDFIMQLPKGYETLLEERGANLSGGQRQRIAIARALAIAPRILILDEATAALDYESEAEFQENLKKIAKGRTVIIVAHRLSTVRDADQIMVMDQGQVVEQGSHMDLVELNGVYAGLNGRDRLELG
ncbi:type I secretion system permease/ATPase [Amphritea balenae]|uniref:Type I secretion system permease/ATPase n=1 Tax=Amphritea balenae TaxID=452629 RepID=A0A3P1SZ69_9GAMM|nr:type I secretion system permease/ATPase [Amphritea balenae]